MTLSLASFAKTYYGPSDEEILGMYIDLVPVNPKAWEYITNIEPHIFLGGVPKPTDEAAYESNFNMDCSPHFVIFQHRIKNLISFSDYPVIWNLGYLSEYQHHVVYDHYSTEIWRLFEMTNALIEKAKCSGEAIFVHCHAGISRSVTCLAAYYLKNGIPESERSPTVKEVVRFLQSRRSFVIPNPGFLKQLQMYREYLDFQNA